MGEVLWDRRDDAIRQFYRRPSLRRALAEVRSAPLPAVTPDDESTRPADRLSTMHTFGMLGTDCFRPRGESRRPPRAARRTPRPVLAAAAGALILWASPASAQHVFESVGERALGMGGAFVAVADDATAVHWNPAGLVTGPAAGMTIGWGWFQIGNQDAVPLPGPARRRRWS